MPYISYPVLHASCLLHPRATAKRAANRGLLSRTRGRNPRYGCGSLWRWGSMVSARSITAGEGGLTVTKHADVHYRMLTSAYYNKRCKFEIPAGLHLHQSSVTGADLKNRAHPLAIAVALNQLQKHRDIPFCKSIYARQLASKLAYIPFLEMPLIQPARAQSPLGTRSSCNTRL